MNISVVFVNKNNEVNMTPKTTGNKKPTYIAQNFCLSSKRSNGRIASYVTVEVTL